MTLEFSSLIQRRARRQTKPSARIDGLSLGAGLPGFEAEKFGGAAAQDVALRLLAQKRQVVDLARQIEVPMRIVGRIEKLRISVNPLEAGLHQFPIVL